MRRPPEHRKRQRLALVAGALAATALAWLVAAVSGRPTARRPRFHLEPTVRARVAPGTAALNAAARPGGGLFWLAGLVLALLGAAGVVAVVLLVVDGPEPRAKWGYAAAVLAFLLSTAQAAPLLAFATRLSRGLWATPLRRPAELFGLAGLASAPLHLVLLWQLPDFHDRPSIWHNWPGAPHLWDALSAILLALLGLLLLHASALPDLAATRDQDGGGLAGRLALGWRGSARQWGALSRGLIVLGGLYLMLYVFVHLVTVSDLALSLVPGWSSASAPAYHAVTGLQGGVAVTLIAAAVLLRTGRLERRTTAAAFHPAGKLLLTLALLSLYLLWAEFLTYWYSRTPEEIRLMDLLMFGPYRLAFLLGAALTFAVPVLLLMWNPVRASVLGPTLAAASTLMGLLFDRARIYAAAWSVAGPVREQLERVPPAYPQPVDLVVGLGAIAAVGLLYGLGARLLPIGSAWETKLDALLRSEQPYLHTTVSVVAKPS